MATRKTAPGRAGDAAAGASAGEKPRPWLFIILVALGVIMIIIGAVSLFSKLGNPQSKVSVTVERRFPANSSAPQGNLSAASGLPSCSLQHCNWCQGL